MSKADGETLKDFFALFSFCKETEEQNYRETFENVRQRFEGKTNNECFIFHLQIMRMLKDLDCHLFIFVLGSLAYRAPEVLQGSETSIGSDLWALGCILYYMYTGTYTHAHVPSRLVLD